MKTHPTPWHPIHTEVKVDVGCLAMQPRDGWPQYAYFGMSIDRALGNRETKEDFLNKFGSGVLTRKKEGADG